MSGSEKLDPQSFNAGYFGGGSISHYDTDYEHSSFREAYRALFVRFARRFLPLGSGECENLVLDIGAATGNIVEKLGRIPRTRAVGADLSFWALKTGRQSNPAGRGELVQAYAEELPFPAGTFHHLVSLYVFEHVPRSEKLLAECRRILKPGGRALIMIDTAKGCDRTHVSIHPRSWWKERFESEGFAELPAWPTALSQIADVLPSWQRGHSRLNPALYTGLFLWELKK
ncbi:MAG: class I SAM-dependent methyltransferase [Verrucomicrobiae bacterium]|nr:class I SAM-dependent methyltransferase [Verrucomicrobiae bacterium]